MSSTQYRTSSQFHMSMNPHDLGLSGFPLNRIEPDFIYAFSNFANSVNFYFINRLQEKNRNLE